MDMNFIPEDALENRRVYAIRCRNLRFGVWDAKTGSFFGVREKFGDRFIDNEYQWRDRDGTANATEALDIWLPEDVPLQALLYLICQGCEKRVEQIYEYDPDFKPNKGMKRTGDRHIDPADAEACEKEDGTYLAMWLSNKDLYAFMEEIEAENPWEPQR